MPASPEVCDGVTAIRMAEVLVEVEPQATPETDRHITITREIEVYLQGKSHNTYPRTRRRQVLQAVGKELIGDL